MKLHPKVSILLSLLVHCAATLNAQTYKPLELKLPTVNRHIFGSTPEKFYMYCDRTFEGKTSKPWTAGKYGFVRNLRRTGEGVIATRFHEGIDIAPVKRDSARRPLDIVHAIAPGKVVYICASAAQSNYGKYIVLEHNWGYGPFYSLYAHLADVSCKLGDSVHSGMPIAKLGYTGAGINRERAHLHLECNILLSERFSAWHDKHFDSPNHHGNFNGINLAGLNISELFIRHERNPHIKLTDFLAKVPVHYKVTVPNQGALEICTRYPWLLKHSSEKAHASWEISFASSGFPLAVHPSQRRVTSPTLTAVKSTRSNHRYHTKGMVSGEGSRATLTKRGLRFIELLTGSFSS